MQKDFSGIQELSHDQRETFELAQTTMREITGEEVLTNVRREIYDAHPEFAEFLEDFVKQHAGKKLYFCWYKAKEIAVLFDSSDHSGVWFSQFDNLVGTGKLTPRHLAVLESIVAGM